MNERERLLAVLEGGRADKTPWYGDLSWWHAAHTAAGDLPEMYRDSDTGPQPYQSQFQLAPTTGKGYLRLYREAGIGIMLYAPMVWRETFSQEIRFSSHPDGNRTVVRISTPVGEIESTSEYLPGSFSSKDLGRLGQTLQDLNSRGVSFLITYGDSPEGRKLLAPWAPRRFRTRRNIAGFSGHRRDSYELVATNRTPGGSL